MKTPKKMSIIESEKPIDEVIYDMEYFCDELEFGNIPYGSVLSKKQLWSREDAKRASIFHSYKALEFPWSELDAITDRAMYKFLKEMLEDRTLPDVQFILGSGYIKKDGTMDMSQKSAISVYVFRAYPDGSSTAALMIQIYDGIQYIVTFLPGSLPFSSNLLKNLQVFMFPLKQPDMHDVFFLADHAYLEKQNIWVNKQDKQTRFQIALNKATHVGILSEEKAQVPEEIAQLKKALCEIGHRGDF